MTRIEQTRVYSFSLPRYSTPGALEFDSARVRRKKRSARRRAQASGPTASPYIRRAMPWFDMLDEEQLTLLESQVDWFIQDVGIAFRDDPTALETLREAGATLKGDLVTAPADFIRALCAKAPIEFTQLARNPARSVHIGGNSQVFAPIYGAPFVKVVYVPVMKN